MPEQLSLDGLGEPPANDRLLFLLYLEAAAAERATELARRMRGEHRLTGYSVAADRLHVTLFHLGDYSGLRPALIEAAARAAANVRRPVFDVSFDYVMSFGRQADAPFVLRGDAGVATIKRLQQALGIEMERAGLRRQARPRLEPHVTLLYDRQSVEPQRIEPIGWQVREFFLVHSLLGRTQHATLGRWPLLA